MKKIYIDIENEIWVDPECTMISFDNPINGKKKDPIKVGTDQIWALFRHLFLNRNTPVSNHILYEVCNMKSTDASNKTNLHRIVNALRNTFYYEKDNEKTKAACLNITAIKDTENNNSLAILSSAETRNWSGDKVKADGTYTLYIPAQPNQIISELAPYYWDAYSNIGAQKNSGRHDTSVNKYDLNAKLGEVFQVPKLIPSLANDSWGWHAGTPINIFLVAPNGYGKTAFLRALLLSSISRYNHELADPEREKYEAIIKYHNLPKDCLPLYLECQYINFDLLESNLMTSNHAWIYQALCERLLINRLISEDSFFQDVSSHLASSNVLLLIDGFDEISKDNRKLLYTALTKYQENTNFNPHLSIIIATRPLSMTEEFIGFNKWYIASIKQNEDFLHAYVNAYAGSAKEGEISAQITNNPYLSDLVTTPATLVWTIKTCLDNRPVYEAVEMIMTEVMRRNNYSELRTQEPAYKKIYAELAYKYLTQLNDSDGIDCSEHDFFLWLISTLDSLANRGERKIIKLLESKTEEELEQLFFTQVALMEFDSGYLRFSTPIYAYHLVARRILSLLDSTETDLILKDLDRIPCLSRYKTIVVALTLGEHYHEPKFSDISYESNVNLKQLLADTFYEYLTTKLCDSATTEQEKTEIQTAISDILNEKYGSNVFTGSNFNPQYIHSLENLHTNSSISHI